MSTALSLTPPSTPSSPQPSTFFQNAKCRLSEHKPGSIRNSMFLQLNESMDNVNSKLSKIFPTSTAGHSIEKEWVGEGEGSGSIVPYSHRENTGLHALKDTFTIANLALPHLNLNLNLNLHTPSFPFSIPTTFSNPLPNLFCHSNSDTISDDEDDVALPESKNSKKEKVEKEKVPEKLEPENDPLKRLRGNVVVMGGYRGSILRDAKTNKRLWIPLRVGLGLRKADLSIGLSDEDEINASSTIVATKMLMAAGGIIDLGKRLKDKLKSLEQDQINEPNRLRFHSWGYDWRRNLDLSSKELILFLERLKKESQELAKQEGREGEGATVIAHSMGGLVALHALATASDPSIFKGIIFAGTPFKGCVNVLEPFRRGDGVMFNREICSPAVVFSMRSSFYFLPSYPNPILPCFYTPQGVPISLNFASPKTWSDFNLSPVSASILEPESLQKTVTRNERRKEAEFAEERIGDGVASFDGADGNGDAGDDIVETDTPEPELTGNVGNVETGFRIGTPDIGKLNVREESDGEIANYLDRTLKRVEEFYKTLHTSHKSNIKYPPIAILTSTKTPTVRGVIASSSTSIESGDYSLLLFSPGDGIVEYESAISLPGDWNKELKGVIESGNGHVSLLGDLDSVRKCLDRIYPLAVKDGSC